MKKSYHSIDAPARAVVTIRRIRGLDVSDMSRSLLSFAADYGWVAGMQQ